MADGRHELGLVAVTALGAGFAIGEGGRAGVVGWLAMVAAVGLFLWVFWRATSR